MKCDAGCVVFDGGERKHLKTCPFYPESRTKMYDDVIAENTKLRNALEDIAWTDKDLKWAQIRALITLTS